MGADLPTSMRTHLREKIEDLVLSHYMPINYAFKDNGEHVTHWLKAGGSEFREPFAIGTVERIMERTHRLLTLSTGTDALLRHGSGQKRLYPTGWIYHVSRCGSTLLANMVKAIDQHFVLSEPELPLIDAVRSPGRLSRSELRDLTRASVLALCSRAPRAATHSFVKLFQGYTLDLPLIRESLPGVREVFVYRDPVEVIVSLITGAPPLWLWSEYMAGLPLATAVERPAVELAARMVGRLLAAMHLHAGDDTLLINYDQIGPQTPELMMAFWGIPCDASKAETMRSALRLDAKDRQQKQEFIADSDRKQRGASAMVRDAAEEYASDAYLKREELREKRAASARQPVLTASDWRRAAAPQKRRR